MAKRIREDKQARIQGDPIASDDDEERLVTVGNAAAMLHVHPNTIRNWADWGYIPSVRIGPRRDRRFKYRDVVKLIPRFQIRETL